MARKSGKGPKRPQGHRGKSDRSGGHRPRSGSEPGLPSREQVLAFIEEAQGKVGKREIAKAFGIKGGEKIALKRLLAEMADEGLLTGGRKELRQPGSLPPMAVLEITARDRDGDLIGEPVVWNTEEGARPRILILAQSAKRLALDDRALGIGDHIMARITRLDEVDVAGFHFEAEAIRKLPRDQRRLLGVFRAIARGGGLWPSSAVTARIKPTVAISRRMAPASRSAAPPSPRASAGVSRHLLWVASSTSSATRASLISSNWP